LIRLPIVFEEMIGMASASVLAIVLFAFSLFEEEEDDAK